MLDGTIAISGKVRAGSSSVAKMLADRLGSRYFSVGELFKDLSRGSSSEWRQKFYYEIFRTKTMAWDLDMPGDDQSGTESENAMNMWLTQFGKDSRLHKALDETQEVLAEEGNIVIEGKLTLYMLRAIENVKARVWLTASDDKRLERAAKQEMISLSDARELILPRERIERAEWKRIYGIDYWDQETADYTDRVIDTTDMNVKEVRDGIMEYISQNGEE